MTRLGYVMTTGLTVMLIGGLSVLPITPRLIWNASGSTPIGLYAIERSPRLEVTDLVAVDAPEPLASFLAGRGYLPRGVPLLKRVAGLPGQRVCRAGARRGANSGTMRRYRNKRGPWHHWSSVPWTRRTPTVRTWRWTTARPCKATKAGTPREIPREKLLKRAQVK